MPVTITSAAFSGLLTMVPFSSYTALSDDSSLSIDSVSPIEPPSTIRVNR